ncbi:MAG TPA: DUF1588 domain-containing protein [Polyangiaceae bacterium]
MLALGCQGQLSGKSTRGSGAGSGIASGAGASNGAGSGGLGSSGDGSGGLGTGGSGAAAGPGPVKLPDGTTVFPMYERIRRLTIAEYQNSVDSVVSGVPAVTSGFVPDSRQQGYTVNDAQEVDPVLVKQISTAASTLAAQVKTQLTTYAPCTDPTTQADQCATSFIQSFAKRAYRRPVEDDEVAQLLTLFHAGTNGGTYADGIELVARGVLQAASFLYLTEIGDGTTAIADAGAGANVIKLTPYEIASELSYLLTASPPDDTLIAAAVNGDLDTGDGRVNAANSIGTTPLLQQGSALDRVTRIITEWLGTDSLQNTDKDSTKYPNYTALKPAMVQETPDFIWNLVRPPNMGTVGELLGADWTSVTTPELAAMYSATGNVASPPDPLGHGSVVNLPTRRGILNQGAFLSVYAHASETAPVLRGVALLRRVACITIKSPTELNIQVVPPLPNTHVTNRSRYATHAADPMCAQCHDAIDSFGFSFELYDGMGEAQTTDNDMNLPIDSTTVLALKTDTGADFDANGSYADSNAVATALSTSPTVRECFARQVFRASSGRSDSGAKASEDAFVTYWKTVANASGGNIVNTILAYAENPAFIYRSPQQ